METYYVSNQNGDWWTMTKESPLYVISKSELSEIVARDGDNLESDYLDKLDQTIQAHGEAIAPLSEYERGMRDALDYLSALYPGVYQTDLAAEYASDLYEGGDK